MMMMMMMKQGRRTVLLGELAAHYCSAPLSASADILSTLLNHKTSTENGDRHRYVKLQVGW
jgi:hypothetical protein